ncbi:unnamed protein product, partial [Rhizoctonia solani]
MGYLKGYEAIVCGPALHELAKRQDIKSIVQDCETACPDLPTTEVPLTVDEPFRASQDLGIQWTTLQPVFAVASEPVDIAIQPNAPWGLARLNQDMELGFGPYEYRYSLVGDPPPVDAYVIDSGVKLDHAEFGGCAHFGQNFTLPDPGLDRDYVHVLSHTDVIACYDTSNVSAMINRVAIVLLDDGDKIGHGTHVAGIIAGNSVGVAKYMVIISVKVLARAKGVARIVEVIEWVLKQVAASGNPSIINMSLSHTATQIGAVGIFAPGVDIMSAAIYDQNGKPSTTALGWGTCISMAAPHVTGRMTCMIKTGGKIDVVVQVKGGVGRDGESNSFIRSLPLMGKYIKY